MTDKPLEKTVEELSMKARVVDGLKAVPPIIACAAGAYLLGFGSCGHVEKVLPQDGLNFGYHLAAGSGLYGGYTSNSARRITSLVTLGASFFPEIMLLSQNGDLKEVGVAAGVKAVGYGLGYIVGHLFGE